MNAGLQTTFVTSGQVKQIDEMKKEKAKAKELDTLSTTVQTNLAGYIKKVWEINRNSRDTVNTRLLNCLRARKGEYSASQLATIAGSGGADPIYLKLTGTKCRAAAAWLRDILIPVRDKSWEIIPTPIPSLPEDLTVAVTKSAFEKISEMLSGGMSLSMDEQVKFSQLVKEKVLGELQDLAKTGVDNASLKIEDIMAEGNWTRAFEEVIEDFVTYPYAVLKGPYYQTKRVLSWQGGVPVPKTETVLCWRRVSPFDFYYSPTAKTAQEGDLIERLRYSQKTLYDLIGVEGYNDESIRAVLQDFSNGGLHNWMWTDFEKDYLENNSAYFKSDKDTIDGGHFWGHVKGQDLIDWGYKGKVEDPLKMYPVDAILIGNHVIRAEINKDPMESRPYHSSCWDAVPGSLVGIALAEQMEDHQKMVNATARSLATNLSLSSGPQVAILTDMLAEGESITSVYPMKIWQMKSSITGNSGKPVEFFQPQINSVELLNVLNAFEQKADDVTNVPRYSYGNEKIGGAGSTATGLSMLMNSAAKGIRRAIANIDLNMIQPSVYQTFVKVMLKEPDPSIRGDVKITARGSAATLIKEQLQANQKEFLQITSNPLDIEILGKKGRAELLKQIADGMGLDISGLPTKEELEMAELQEKAMEKQAHEAEVAQAQAQAQGATQPEAGQQVDPAQLQALEQQAQQVEKEGQMVQQQAKAVGQQMKTLEAEAKKLKAVQGQIEEQMAQLAVEKINTETAKVKSAAELERAQIKLDMAMEELKAMANKVKLITATKEDEVAHEGKDVEKNRVEAAKPQVDAAIQKALTLIAESLSQKKGKTNISINREDGKIVGATVTPAKV